MGNAVRIKVLKNELSHSHLSNQAIWFGHLVAPTMITFTVIISFYSKKAVRNYVVKEMRGVLDSSNAFYQINY